ncbi:MULTISPECIES: ABC transporter ATP-binding protein [unclassified Enterococcus]|uniref:ABC transporter ATP-binding protein n=1 Tax=unclassified Enterococcus TaxID=2608891 RepID=UPI001551D5A7|nr:MULTISPECIES: ABC transporter ATP-binding protein [unclassified Enterococcus]MBS7577589.1 ABC transporter ATP-binding protein [Enterococcus sp. MMGLQ5-2]MBS7584912.1 ABC transporter ATP-binding protein [Enterococcus sp. MMGLQ5-1]NPD12767.1 ABC transporter ATP-binding protein [Enterococcus sp. MMGLQ5-1]NPD37422.1 ABC transporter ATP-binding protein [Enterococcus sp. MMGLQ5-2]
MLKLTNISKSYKQGDTQIAVLKGIQLTINQGEFCAIMGPSGSGKSTLMNILGCLDLPTEGIYELDERNVAGLSENQLADIRNQKIGFVFQNFNLMPRLTALQNVELPLVYAKVPKEERKIRALNMLEEVGLSDRKNFFPAELSGGQKQRVAIARALVTNAPIILADEPTGALDTMTGDQIMAILKNLNHKGKTIIVITHEMEIADYCERLIVIRDGIIQ